jgi:hypothetical protein
MFELRVTAGLPMHLRRAAMVGDLWTTFHFWFSVVRASALADGVARILCHIFPAFCPMVHGTRVVIFFPRARAYAADRLAIAIAASVHVEIVDEDLAWTAHEVLVGPLLFVATVARGRREIILEFFIIVVVGEGFFRTGRRSERVADARIWPLDARTVTLG